MKKISSFKQIMPIVIIAPIIALMLYALAIITEDTSLWVLVVTTACCTVVFLRILYYITIIERQPNRAKIMPALILMITPFMFMIVLRLTDIVLIILNY